MIKGTLEDQLLALNNDLIEMGGLIEHAIAQATEALLEQNADQARTVIENDAVIDGAEKEIEALCLKMLLQKQPVASDFRQISTVLKMLTDMERIGDHASDISELCIFLSTQDYILNLDRIPQMATVTARMVTESINAFVDKDEDQAYKVIKFDDEVDRLFDAVKSDLIALVHEDAQKGEQAFDLLQIAKYYERIGDHAVNIAEWVIFSITGLHKGRKVL
jgi:phosphate transport system protein